MLIRGNIYYIYQGLNMQGGTGMKRLYRSTTDRWIAGVCGGIGEYFGIDPNIIRLIWVIVTIITGFIWGILVYILLWIILPQREQPKPSETKPPAEQQPQTEGQAQTEGQT
jgi:phage shock protein C